MLEWFWNGLFLKLQKRENHCCHCWGNRSHQSTVSIAFKRKSFLLAFHPWLPWLLMHFSCCLLSKRNQQVAKKLRRRRRELIGLFTFQAIDWIWGLKEQIRFAICLFSISLLLRRKKTCFALLSSWAPLLIYTLETPVVGSTSNTASPRVEKLLC